MDAINGGDVRGAELSRPRGGLRDRRTFDSEPATGFEHAEAHVAVRAWGQRGGRFPAVRPGDLDDATALRARRPVRGQPTAVIAVKL